MASRADTEASINNDHGLLAKPLHLQRLEQALRLEPLLDYMQNVVFNESPRYYLLFLNLICMYDLFFTLDFIEDLSSLKPFK